ncbi:MAG: apolipoprotein N-acyltransferase [Acidobacteriota bacterium]
MLDVLPSKKSSRLLFALASGVLLALCFPNFSILPLLPVALVPLLAALDGLTWRRAFLPGFVFGGAFWLVTIPWIAYTVNRFGGVGPFLAGLALAITAAICAVPFGAMASLYAAGRARTGPGIVAAFAAAWAIQEGLRTYVWIFGGFPWNLLANPLADVPALLGSTALGGVVFTSFLLAALNAALFVAWTRPRRNARLGWLLGAAVCALAAAAVQPLRPRPSDEVLKVGVVQPNVDQSIRWDPGTAERIQHDLEEQTRALCRADRPVVVLWPESASPYSWSFNAVFRERVRHLCRELDVAILMSTVWSDAPGDDDAPYYNAALLVTKDGPALPPYFKQRLVPFGEYVPLGPVLRLIKPISRAVPGGFTPGSGAVLLKLGNWSLGGAVCYEVVYPWIARAEARAGADVLFTLTNDAWYGRAGAQRQHWQAAVLRAVETGRPLVRAAVTGISGAVNPDGRVLVSLPAGRKGAFSAPVFRTSGAPPAVAAGDAILWVCAAGLLAGILRARFPSPRGPVAVASCAPPRGNT